MHDSICGLELVARAKEYAATTGEKVQ
jgi:hypothetical protein